jgi:hypothetical protein
VIVNEKRLRAASIAGELVSQQARYVGHESVDRGVGNPVTDQ